MIIGSKNSAPANFVEHVDPVDPQKKHHCHQLSSSMQLECLDSCWGFGRYSDQPLIKSATNKLPLNGFFRAETLESGGFRGTLGGRLKWLITVPNTPIYALGLWNSHRLHLQTTEMWVNFTEKIQCKSERHELICSSDTN